VRVRCAVMLALFLVPSAGMAALAQARAGQGNRFTSMDRNRDGVITRDEWRGSERSFEVHDWNRDGVLSGDELRPGALRQQQWPDDPADATADSELSEWTPERFDNLDHNRDGRLTPDEWHFDTELFRRVDRDRDGSISRREFLGLGDDDDRDDRFSDLDVNRDGRVSGAEWHGDPRLFGTLDTDRNGYLSRTELVGAGQDEVPADLFASLDVNRDRRVTSDEWHWSRASFDRRDVNKDGVLSRDELSSPGGRAPAAAQNSAAYRAGYDRGVQDGRQAGREDRTRNHWDLGGQRELEQADAGYTPGVGDRSEYQAGYREGFTRAYREGFGPRP
jgi:Ca2+-binding EF-hand superfamily protein